jgi:superfamily II DNA or RNA helicase
MKLITGLFSKKEDILVAEDAMKDPDKIIKEIEENFDIDNIENLFIRESIKAFGWMLANKLLEIKIALPKKNHLFDFPALFHQKIGIIRDTFGNELSFSGSINETGIGWLKNIEEFKVFRKWEEHEKKYFEKDKKRFFELWNNLSEKVEVIPLPQAIKEKLVKTAPKTIEELDLNLLDGNLCQEINSSKPKEIKLRDYQQKALAAWEERKFQGIIEMATGTGKTYLGLAAILKFFDNMGRGIVIIASPTNEINMQWKNKIEELIQYDRLIAVSSNESKWKGVLENYLHDYNKNRYNRLILLTTYDSLANVSEMILHYNLKIFLIADEVHSFGSEERRKILQDKELESKIAYKLGLSATPERIYDEEGTDCIKNFFGGIIFEYGIGKAIDDGTLCPYNYHLKVVEMTSEEFVNYIDFSKKIIRATHHKDDEQEKEILTKLLNNRAKIIKKSENKIKTLKEILEKLIRENNIKYTFIFGIDKAQLNKIEKILKTLPICYSQITGELDEDNRKKILKEFGNGNIDVLLSIKILDQGIDIPDAKNAIILSSSTNPREYIQRRGRVLRKIENKEKIANIFDFIVIPPLEQNIAKNLFNIERNIVRKELIRAFYFVKYSENKVDIFGNKKVEELIKKYDLSELYKHLRTN